MFATLIRKEVLVLRASYLPIVLLNTVLSLATALALLLLRGAAGSALPADTAALLADPFLLFCVVSLGLTSMMLSIAGPSALIEKTLGIVDTLLASGCSPAQLILSKTVFLSGLAFASFMLSSLVAGGAGVAAEIPFVGGGRLWYDVLVGLVMLPMLMVLLAFFQVLTSVVWPRVGPVVNVVLFAVAFAVFFNVVTVVGQVATSPASFLGALGAGLGVALAGCGWLARRIPAELVVSAR